MTGANEKTIEALKYMAQQTKCTHERKILMRAVYMHEQQEQEIRTLKSVLSLIAAQADMLKQAAIMGLLE